jgi:uncharacterized protein (DUF4415 family)
MKRADAIWNKGPELIDENGEVRELTTEDFDRSVPFSELPLAMQQDLLAIKTATIRHVTSKKPVTMSLSSDVLAKFEKTGEGWETRVDDALRQWLEEHPVQTAMAKAS